MHAQRHDKAIVTLAVGEEYVAGFMRSARPSWEAYCARHGYDLVLLTEPIDPACDFTRKSIHWQKLLVASLPQLRDYARIVWLDGDILINAALAPDIVSAVPGDGIGVVDASGWFRKQDDIHCLHTRYLVLNLLMKRQAGGRFPPGVEKVVVTDGDLPAYYRFVGLDPAPGVERMINTGLFVADPKRHAGFLAEVYAKYPRNFLDFENTPFAYELQAQGQAEYIDPRFNVLWSAVAAEHYPFLFDAGMRAAAPELAGLCATVALRNAWFLHFAGGANNPVVKAAFERVDQNAVDVPGIVFPESWCERAEFMELRAITDLDGSEKGVLF